MEKPTVVAEFDNRLQAETTAQLVGSFGIDCVLSADDLGGMGPGQAFVGGVKVLVDAADVEKARQVLGDS